MKQSTGSLSERNRGLQLARYRLVSRCGCGIVFWFSVESASLLVPGMILGITGMMCSSSARLQLRRTAQTVRRLLPLLSTPLAD